MIYLTYSSSAIKSEFYHVLYVNLVIIVSRREEITIIIIACRASSLVITFAENNGTTPPVEELTVQGGLSFISLIVVIWFLLNGSFYFSPNYRN